MCPPPNHLNPAPRETATPTTNAIKAIASAARRVMPKRNVDPVTGRSLSREGRRLTYKPRQALSNDAASTAGGTKGVGERRDVRAVVVCMKGHADAARS